VWAWYSIKVDNESYRMSMEQLRMGWNWGCLVVDLNLWTENLT